MVNSKLGRFTLEQLRKEYENSSLLLIYEKVFIATIGLTKEARINITQEEIDDILDLCFSVGTNPASVIMGSLAVLLPADEEDQNNLLDTFERATGLTVSVHYGAKEIFIEARKLKRENVH